MNIRIVPTSEIRVEDLVRGDVFSSLTESGSNLYVLVGDPFFEYDGVDREGMPALCLASRWAQELHVTWFRNETVVHKEGRLEVDL